MSGPSGPDLIPFFDATGESWYSFGGRQRVEAASVGIVTAHDPVSGHPLIGRTGEAFWNPWHFRATSHPDSKAQVRVGIQVVNDYDGVYANPVEGEQLFVSDNFSNANMSTREVDAEGHTALPSSIRRIVGSEDKRRALAHVLAEIPMTKGQDATDPIEALQSFMNGGAAGSGGSGGGAGGPGGPGGSVRILDGGARVEFGPGAGGLGGAVIFSGPAAQAALRAMDAVRKAGGTPKQAAEAGAIEAAKHSGGGGALRPRGGQRSGASDQGSDQFGIFGLGQKLSFDFVDREGDPFSFFGANNPLLFDIVDRENPGGSPFGIFGLGGSK